MPAVSVIVPARDAAGTLVHTLDALARQTVEHEVVVVDDGSSDATAAVALEAGAKVVDGPRRGAGAARNAGVAATAGEVLAFTDADCRPLPTWLEQGLAALEGADLVQGRVQAVGGVPIGPFDRTLWVVRAWGLHESANLLVRRELFERVGGFPAGLEPQGTAPFGEDTLFGWFARRGGARYRFSDDAVVEHEVFGRRAREAIAERRRDGRFPHLVRRVPELRRDFLYRRWFLSPRSARLLLAGGAAVAAAAWRRPALLAGVLPYARVVVEDARDHDARVAAVRVVADVVGEASLVHGSRQARCLVL